MSDIDILIEMAKQGPLKYEDVMQSIQDGSLDCAPSVVLEVCCMSRGWDCGALSYLCSIVTAEISEGKPLVIKRYGSSSATGYKDSTKDPCSWQDYPFKGMRKSLKC